MAADSPPGVPPDEEPDIYDQYEEVAQGYADQYTQTNDGNDPGYGDAEYAYSDDELAAMTESFEDPDYWDAAQNSPVASDIEDYEDEFNNAEDSASEYFENEWDEAEEEEEQAADDEDESEDGDEEDPDEAIDDSEEDSDPTPDPESPAETDPRFDWEAFDFIDGPLEFELQLPTLDFGDDHQTVSPENNETVDVVTDEASDPQESTTDPDLGTGTKTVSSDRQSTSSQQFTGPDQWSIHESVQRTYSSNEQSTNADGQTVTFQRTGTESLSISIVDGKQTTTIYTIADTFTFDTGTLPDSDATSDDPAYWQVPESWIDDAGGSVDDASIESGSQSGQNAGSNTSSGSSDPFSRFTGDAAGGGDPDAEPDDGPGPAPQPIGGNDGNQSGVRFRIDVSTTVTVVESDVVLPDGTPGISRTVTIATSRVSTLMMGGSFTFIVSEGDLNSLAPVDDAGDEPEGDGAANNANALAGSAGLQDSLNGIQPGGNGLYLELASRARSYQIVSEKLSLTVALVLPTTDLNLPDEGEEGGEEEDEPLLPQSGTLTVSSDFRVQSGSAWSDALFVAFQTSSGDPAAGPSVPDASTDPELGRDALEGALADEDEGELTPNYSDESLYFADLAKGHGQTDFGVGFTAELDDLAALLRSQLEAQSDDDPEEDSGSDAEPDDGDDDLPIDVDFTLHYSTDQGVDFASKLIFASQARRSSLHGHENEFERFAGTRSGSSQYEFSVSPDDGIKLSDEDQFDEALLHLFGSDARSIGSDEEHFHQNGDTSGGVFFSTTKIRSKFEWTAGENESSLIDTYSVEDRGIGQSFNEFAGYTWMIIPGDQPGMATYVKGEQSTYTWHFTADENSEPLLRERDELVDWTDEADFGITPEHYVGVEFEESERNPFDSGEEESSDDPDEEDSPPDDDDEGGGSEPVPYNDDGGGSAAWAGFKAFMAEGAYQVANAVADEVPIFGSIKGGLEAGTGYDARFGELSFADRAGAGLGVLPMGSTIRRVGGGLGIIGKGALGLVDDAVDAVSDVKKAVTPKGAGKIIDAGSPGSFTARELGEAISSNPQAARAYQKLQQMGFDIRIVNRADDLAGQTSLKGVVNINRRYNGSVQDALETLVHESKHVDLLRTTGDLNGLRGIRKGEYAARAREFFFREGRRPSQSERYSIIQEIIDLGY
ncbi:hypothetical protein [Allorhodopirellula heiligendammensis]|nr:hypothetical protein [Allorhodopirellula heiligendammensis]